MSNCQSANVVSFGFEVTALKTKVLLPSFSRNYFRIINNNLAGADIGIRFNNPDSDANKIMIPGEEWEPVIPPGGRIYIENLDVALTADVLILSDVATDDPLPYVDVAEIGPADDVTISVTWTPGAVTSPTNDYESGVTITVNALPVTFTQDNDTTDYVLDVPAINTDVILISYDMTAGNLQTSTGLPILSFTDTPVTNSIP
jgi:hypothetical protein